MSKTNLTRSLGLTSAVTLVMGSMIGSGIFIVPADIARVVDSPALVIAAWLITGFMTIVAALSYGELAAMMPKAGGQYVFLREALGNIWGFLYGWTLFLVIQTGTIAAVAVAFGKFLAVFFPGISIPLVAISIIILLTVANIFSLKTGAMVQNVFTVAKVSALIGLILIGITLGKNVAAIHFNFGDFWRNSGWANLHAVHVGASGSLEMVGVLTALAIVQVGSLFSADAWNNVTFTAAEVKNPSRNLPLALAIGTGSVILLYIFANFSYMIALPMTAIQSAPQDRVGTLLLEQTFGGVGAKFMAAAILISTFGCVNGMILAGARVYYAMSEDGLFFKSAGTVHPKFKTPWISLVFQGVWTCLLCLSGTYGQLLDYVIFAALIFYVLTISGLFVLRKTKPHVERPYRAIGYPVLPALYIAMALFIDYALLRYKPQYTWPGLIIVCTGIPVYFFWSRKAPTFCQAD